MFSSTSLTRGCRAGSLSIALRASFIRGSDIILTIGLYIVSLDIILTILSRFWVFPIMSIIFFCTSAFPIISNITGIICEEPIIFTIDSRAPVELKTLTISVGLLIIY
ncbi:hypothetical protein DSY4520 [Desulfitobacterium hafniense Y51]|uniref:Uncharacterized protein n=1 Tax=Desulfitobacterium hafniense (strain Y51) TaxID=138119 RepID=Q24NT3_DESHY|nr:hypothetical protein DSY4520 [Desulfitobacterium hafniense Y51]